MVQTYFLDIFLMDSHTQTYTCLYYMYICICDRTQSDVPRPYNVLVCSKSDRHSVTINMVYRKFCLRKTCAVGSSKTSSRVFPSLTRVRILLTICNPTTRYCFPHPRLLIDIPVVYNRTKPVHGFAIFVGIMHF